MRRNLAIALLFVLALVVQTFAPAAGALAGAKSRGGITGIASQEICLTDGKAVGDQTQAPGQASHHRDQCPLCQSVCDGSAPLAGRMAFLAATPLKPIKLRWNIGGRAPPVPDFDYARQARAPPAFS